MKKCKGVTKMSKYQKAKETARIIAESNLKFYGPGNIPEGIKQFHNIIGKRYGLIKEFRANRII